VKKSNRNLGQNSNISLILILSHKLISLYNASFSCPFSNIANIPPLSAPIDTPAITSYWTSSEGRFSIKAFRTPIS
jgi:hypothetical protein